MRDEPLAFPLLHYVVRHRPGVVPVEEASIVVAVSSPHWKEALVACEYLLVKLNVPEVYESDEPQITPLGLRNDHHIAHTH